jgi:hypothetical protein
MFDPHLKQRNRALLWCMVGLSLLLYAIAFVRVGGGH